MFCLKYKSYFILMSRDSLHSAASDRINEQHFSESEQSRDHLGHKFSFCHFKHDLVNQLRISLGKNSFPNWPLMTDCFQVSLDSRVREIINKNMMSPTQRTFDEAQLQIYTLMHRDSYPRFVNSPGYRNLLKTYGGSVRDLTVSHPT